METKDLGKIWFRDRGTWAWDTDYEALDYVISGEDGNGYISRVPCRNIVPGTDDNIWVIASRSGENGESIIRNKITYSSSDTTVSGMAWDHLHIFPEMPSLAFSLASNPQDGKEHQIIIIFETPADLSHFSLRADSELLWAKGIDLGSHLKPSTKYILDINSSSMIALFSVDSGSPGSRRMVTVTDVAIPIGTSYQIRLFTDTVPELVDFDSDDSTIATVDSNGIIKGIATGEATVTVNWAGQTREISVHVGSEVYDRTSLPSQDRAIDEIEIINPVDSLEVGDEVALYAVGISNTMIPKYDVAYYNPIKFITSDPTVAQVVFGTLMAVGIGSCTITATDPNGGASTSFNLTVIAKQEPLVTTEETYIPSIDNTGATDVTVEIAEALAYAETNGYKKISFPEGTYLMNGDNRPNGVAISLPSNMIIDFNGSEIHFEEGSATTSGYTMFRISDKTNVWLLNAHFYGENYGRATVIKKEGDRTLTIGGMSKNIHIENCTFAWSPGFNVGIDYTRNHISSFRPNSKVAGSVEAGGLGANGEPIDANGTWRMADFTNINLTSGGWVVGEFQGYQNAYMRSRLYDICFYDNNKKFLFRKRNCYTYQRYEFPSGVTPKYCKIAFFQTDEPTGYDGDYYSFTMIVDRYSPKDVYFTNCIFRNAVSTGLSPQGGEHVVVDRCTFIDNGYQDPYSHIDWEDGRQSAQGCIVKNCVFRREQLASAYNCQVINGYCRNVTLHDNIFYRSTVRAGDESTMQRCFHNTFEGGQAPSITGKMDSVFAGNLLDVSPTIRDGLAGTHTVNVDNEVIT